ncbi:MAG TPA: hypothetical protein VHV47_15240 [Opitutaceae bacterium]|jgi:hypothetical protein|nr:hypothetical protein [Opitutaceae bacterium]
MKTAPLLAAAGLLSSLGIPLHAGPAYIAASATAQSGYTKAKFASNAPPAEAYVFFQGNFSPGQGGDKAMAATPFLSIARTLAEDLLPLNYRPTADSSHAQLVLAVQWGVTEVQSDAMRDFALQDLQNDLSTFNNNTAASTGQGVKLSGVNTSGIKASTTMVHLTPAATVNMDLSVAEAGHQAMAQSAAYNAQLLGFADEIAKSQNQMQTFASSHSKGDELLDLLTDPRYFLVVQAFDYRQMQQSRHPLPLWTSRVSVQATGHTFTEILPALCREAALYAGRPTVEVRTDAVDLSP